MKLHFLGTGTSQGIPVIGSQHPVCLSSDIRDKRLRVSVWIHDEETSLVIDCGPDFRYQMLRSGCLRLDAILFTHEHADHTAGLDDIRPFVFKEGALPIYGNKRVLTNLAQRFDYIFVDENKYPGAPSVQPRNIESGEEFTIGKWKITPIEVQHGNLPILGFRINDLVYITDMKSISDESIELIKGCKVLVINALRREEHPMHLNIDQALEFIRKINPQKTYLTHISHWLGFHDEVSKELPTNVYLAHDSLEITL